MNRKINYSIIIPHKNIPDLLKRCLASIPRREDVQIIVVDDNSDPDIVNFEQFPGLNDPFVEVVFTKEGRGLGYVLNVGMTKTVGKWVLIADADDFFNYCIHDILDEYVDSDEDIIFFKHNSVDSDMYTTTYRCTHFYPYVDSWLHSSPKADALLRYRFTSDWAKIMKTEFIKKNSILFDEVSIATDVTFSYLSGFYAGSIRADPRALYCTTIRKGSIRHKKKTIKNELDNLYVLCKRYRFCREHNISFYKNIQLAEFLIKIYRLDKSNFHKAKNIIVSLGFTSGEIIKLCIYDVLINIPKKILRKLFFHSLK